MNEKNVYLTHMPGSTFMKTKLVEIYCVVLCCAVLCCAVLRCVVVSQHKEASVFCFFFSVVSTLEM